MQNVVNAQRANTTDSLKFNVFNYISASSNKHNHLLRRGNMHTVFTPINAAALIHLGQNLWGGVY